MCGSALREIQRSRAEACKQNLCERAKHEIHQLFIVNRGFDIVEGTSFIPIRRDGQTHWLALNKSETLNQKQVCCMLYSRLLLNIVLSPMTDTTHILLKLNLFPQTTMSHACHMLSARWSFFGREWELANSDGRWISIKRLFAEG